MDEFEKLFQELGFNSSSISIRQEPEYSKSELLKLERQFGIDSEVVVYESFNLIGQLPNNIIKKWLSLYDDFTSSGGRDADINSNKLNSYITTSKKAASQTNRLTAFLL